MLAQLRRTQRAVQAKGQRLGMAQRIPERFRRLARKGTARGIGNRAGNHHRPATAGLLKELLDGKQGGLGIERIENGFDQQQIRPAIRQPLNGNEIIAHQLVELHIPEARVIHIGRNRGRARCRPKHARNKSRLRRHLLRSPVASLARELRTTQVELINQRLQPVIRLRNGRRIKRIRLEDIRTCRQVLLVNALDDFRLRQQQQIIVALEILCMAGKTRATIICLRQPVTLDHRPHRTIENQNALTEKTTKFLGTIGLHGGSLVKNKRAILTRSSSGKPLPIKGFTAGFPTASQSTPRRYCTASAMWEASTFSLPARSAQLRATLRMR